MIQWISLSLSNTLQTYLAEINERLELIYLVVHGNTDFVSQACNGRQVNISYPSVTIFHKHENAKMDAPIALPEPESAIARRKISSEKTRDDKCEGKKEDYMEAKKEFTTGDLAFVSRTARKYLPENLWVANTGCTNHLTPFKQLFESLESPVDIVVYLADDTS